MKWTDFFWVFLGSGFGGSLRFGISLAGRHLGWTFFPISTLLSNFLACGMAAWILSRYWPVQPLPTQWHLILVVGFCGGFSTFSTFGLETWTLLSEGKGQLAIINIGLSLFVGLLAIWIFFRQ